jgi:ribosomal protein L11 methyltransferase
LADRVVWPALILRGNDDTSPDLIAAFLDDFALAAIEDFAHLPLPPGGLWDPTCPPPPEPPPSPLHWRVFFASSADRDRAAEALRHAHAELSIERDDVPDEDWAARSQRELTAITAGAFIVAPPWDQPIAVPPGTRVIVIEPSRGFGTGHHASTRLCLRALSDVEPRGKRVLDLGTGSGVLAMAAALKDAREVLAIDVDPDAIESARASAALNQGIESVQWLVGDFREPRWVETHGGPWDVVLANLTGGMLISAAARVRETLAQGGTLIASGFDESEHAAVADALQLTPQASFSEQSWVGLILRRR